MYEPVGLGVRPFESANKVLCAHDDGTFCRAHNEVITHMVLKSGFLQTISEADEVHFDKHFLLTFGERVAILECFLSSVWRLRSAISCKSIQCKEEYNDKSKDFSDKMFHLIAFLINKNVVCLQIV